MTPSNILLDEGVDRALLTDFGLARTEDDACLTHSGFHPGTPHYMSPEQVRGDAIDGRSDLLSLGCVLYAMCVGRPPFRAETSYAVLRRITDDTARPIRQVNPNVPDWLDQIVMKLLSKSREDRFDSADDVAELLEDCLAHVQHPTTALLPEGAALSSPARGGRPPWGKLIAATAFAFSLLFAGNLIVLELNKGTLPIVSDALDALSQATSGESVPRDPRIVVDLYVGKDLLGEMNTTGAKNASYVSMLQNLNAIEGVVVNFHERGPRNQFSSATVCDPAARFKQETLETGRPSELRNAISKALGQIRLAVCWAEGEGENVDDAANRKWGDGEPLQVAKRVFTARRQLLSNFQLSYRTTNPLSENSGEADAYAAQPNTAGFVEAKAVANDIKKVETKSGSGIVTVGFSGSNVYYYDRPAEKSGPATGWIYDGQKMTRLRSETVSERLEIVTDMPTRPDFSSLFCGSPNPLQIAGLMAMSETTVPYIDEFFGKAPDASARWILREMDSYANPRPWRPRFDRMLLVEFEYTIPMLLHKHDGNPHSLVSPIRVAYVLDPAIDYWPIWYQTRTQFGAKAFHVMHLNQQNMAGQHVHFPYRMIEETEDADGLEVTDWMIGKPVNLQTVFGDAAPDLAVDDDERRNDKETPPQDNT